MTWNYRVVKTVTEKSEVVFGIHEVYYDEHDRPVMYSSEPIACFAEDTLDALGEEIERFKTAYDKPVLTHSDFVERVISEDVTFF